MEHDTDFRESSVRFSFFALGVILFSWSAYALATAGAFSRVAVILLSILAVAGIAVVMFRWLSVESVIAKIVFAVTIVYAICLLSGVSPSVFSGRDQGSIAEAAIGLSETGRLPISSPAGDTFFAIYGKGKALNFPGFFYAADGSLRSQFPTSYTAWLGTFYSLFGLPGLVAGNGILLILSFLTLFVLVRTLSDEWTASGSVIIAAASFIPSWFAKFTLTENLALFLFLFLSLSLILFLRNPRRIFLLASVASATLLAVTRIEGLLILTTTLALLAFSKPGKAFSASEPFLLRTIPIGASAAILLLDFLGNIPHYSSIAKALLQDISPSTSGAGSEIVGRLSTVIPLWRLFFPYGMLPVIILGFAAVIFLLVRKDRIGIVPALLALPTFLYLVDPNISADHPWMLRRLLFSVWPALLISFSIALSSFLSGKGVAGKRIAFMSSVLVAFAGLSPTIYAFPFSENGKLLDETHGLSELIGRNDLVLIDRGATGDPYAIPAGPLRLLFGKNAAYFFNPEDYAKIPKDRYDHVYLLTPMDGIERWSGLLASLSLVSVLPFDTERLGPLPLADPRFPKRASATTDSLLFSLDPL